MLWTWPIKVQNWSVRPCWYPVHCIYLQYFFLCPEYTVCKASNVKEIHTYMKRRFIQRPVGIPNPELIRKPKWSTWSQFQRDVNQAKVLDFAGKRGHLFIFGVIEFLNLMVQKSWIISKLSRWVHMLSSQLLPFSNSDTGYREKFTVTNVCKINTSNLLCL